MQSYLNNNMNNEIIPYLQNYGFKQLIETNKIKSRLSIFNEKNRILILSYISSINDFVNFSNKKKYKY